ncbi:outer membrane beta-barrel protein [Chitinophagaceae bacterium MMS25-I14]
MKKFFALAALLLVQSAVVLAQDTDNSPDSKAEVKKPSRDLVMLQLTYNGWANKPDSVKTKGIGRGFSAYIGYDFPINKSSFSFAAGIGLSFNSVYLDNQQIVVTDTGTKGNQVTFIGETKDYSKYKVSTTYLEAPFELRYFGNKENRNRGFKAAIGLKVGTLLSAYTKGVYKVNGTKTADKVVSKRYLETWNFAGTARIGWGNFSIVGNYNLKSLFKEGQGPDVVPYSIGICLSGL